MLSFFLYFRIYFRVTSKPIHFATFSSYIHSVVRWEEGHILRRMSGAHNQERDIDEERRLGGKMHMG